MKRRAGSGKAHAVRPPRRPPGPVAAVAQTGDTGREYWGEVNYGEVSMAYKPDYPPTRPGKLWTSSKRILLTLLGLALIWHFTLFLGLRERHPGMKINPVTNVVHVPPELQRPSGPIPPRGISHDWVERQAFEQELRRDAEAMIDLYALLIPWTVEFD